MRILPSQLCLSHLSIRDVAVVLLIILYLFYDLLRKGIQYSEYAGRQNAK
jgi:hypothetical protein